MVWKSVDTVIELSEQPRMIADTEYAGAVQRLRTRQCHFADVEVFNMRLIKSAVRPEGVDMGEKENSCVAVIVNTNLLLEVLKMEKARSSCTSTGPELILCAACDIIPSTRIQLSRTEAEQILKIRISSSKDQGALLGFVPLFISMPIILRTRNLSTDLKITNGS